MRRQLGEYAPHGAFRRLDVAWHDAEFPPARPGARRGLGRAARHARRIAGERRFRLPATICCKVAFAGIATAARFRGDPRCALAGGAQQAGMVPTTGRAASMPIAEFIQVARVSRAGRLAVRFCSRTRSPETMDTLITRARNGTARRLRALGVTAQTMSSDSGGCTIVAPGALADELGRRDRSPPLEAYLQALELFAETFRPAGGLRLLRIARPAILFYGLYNPNLLENDQDLLQLIIIRGYLATAFDSILPSAGARSVEPQVLLDMLVMELDRGLDLLALGPQPAAGGKTERRAICYWLIVRVIRQLLLGYYAPVGGNPVKNPLPGPLSAEAALDPNFEGDLVRIAATYAGQSQVLTRLNNAFAKYDAMTIFQPPPAGQPLPIGNPNLLPLPQDVQIAVREELQVQEALEERWRKLVGTVAPEAGDQEGIFRLLDLVIKQAMADVALAKLPGQLRLPPQFEESLERIARWQR